MTYILQDHCVENKQYCVRAMQKQESKEGQQETIAVIQVKKMLVV